jgi:hypothetical protein
MSRHGAPRLPASGQPGPAQAHPPQRSGLAGWTSTTLDADTPHLVVSRQPVDCHQPCDGVHLGAEVAWAKIIEGVCGRPYSCLLPTPNGGRQ